MLPWVTGHVLVYTTSPLWVHVVLTRSCVLSTGDLSPVPYPVPDKRIWGDFSCALGYDSAPFPTPSGISRIISSPEIIMPTDTTIHPGMVMFGRDTHPSEDVPLEPFDILKWLTRPPPRIITFS